MNTDIKDKLICDLKEAYCLSKEYSGGYSDHFDSAEEFSSALYSAKIELESGNDEIIDKLLGWFAPTCDWDDFIRNDGLELGNRILEKIKSIKTNVS